MAEMRAERIASGETFAIELVEVDDARAARERKKQTAGELEGVMKRQHRECTIASESAEK